MISYELKNYEKWSSTVIQFLFELQIYYFWILKECNRINCSKEFEADLITQKIKKNVWAH